MILMMWSLYVYVFFVFFQAEDGIRDLVRSRGLGDVYKRQGGGYTDDGNGKFGEYTSGISDAYQDDGGFPVGSLHLGGSDPDAASSWDIKAGIGFGRLLEASYGVQGNYGLSLYADQVEKTEYGEARTVYPGGTPIARLPAGYVPGASSAAPAFYTGEDIGSKRSTFGLEGLKTLGEQWTVSFDLQRQDKTGDDVMGGNQGFSGTGLVPENINYSTCLLYTSPSPRDRTRSRMPSSA